MRDIVDSICRIRRRARSFALTVVLSLMLPGLAHGATRYVADTGTDGPSCGVDAATACRSITQAIAVANPGDIILVGPGRYGDLDQDGVLGSIAGEETGSPGCGCVLSINKNVIITSSAGAAVTTIDGTTVDANVNVLVITVGGEFGRPGKGFTVTETASTDIDGHFDGIGIALDAANVMVRGNQVIFTRLKSFVGEPVRSHGFGILTVNDAAIRIEGNQVTRWLIGIQSRGAAVVSKNQVIGNDYGIRAFGGSVVGNVATRNEFGFQINAPATVTGNAAYHNRNEGFGIGSSSVVFTKNNMYANASSFHCGMTSTLNGLNAKNNYWGSPSGPATPPADTACSPNPITSPYATKPFAVKILKP
jgi:hypothetical protein